ncbi:MAG: dethiobiotin synthase [Planctomycetes bacterium]|nr:dethiobiotin synthase [Planctomycetota bacterium]
MRSLLVTGTDTGVGKTHVSCALLAALRAAGLRPAAMKPCETGVAASDADALPAGSDAARLLAASGSSAIARDVRPYAFAEPSAPLAAARAAGASIDPRVLDAAFGRLVDAHDLVLVEGAGGLLVPLTEALDFAALARRWDLAVLVVARTGLGTLNHTALTVRAARTARLDLIGVVTNAVDGDVSASDRSNLGLLEALLDGIPHLGEVPHGGDLPDEVAAPVLAALGLRPSSSRATSTRRAVQGTHADDPPRAGDVRRAGDAPRTDDARRGTTDA